jgi:ferritin-like metal-binding protein YciE
MQSISTGMFTDELMKNALADYASEQFEVACYNALVTAAEELDEIEVAGLCRANLVEDQAMADWLDEQIPRFVRHTMQATKSTRP